jgi:hypothetical protein
MAEPIVYPTLDGQELEVPDVDNVGAVAGLADDRVLAEFLRVTPYDGSNVYKLVIPYGYKGAIGAASPGGTVQSSGSANGSIVVSPFRFIVGSRNAPSAPPPGVNPAQNYQPNSLANWRDVRSGIFVGSSTSLAQTFQLAANSSGNPRWDLVCATIAVDASGPSQTRRVKSPSTSNVSTAAVPAWLASPVTVSVITGTPGSSPALPSIPADSGGNYNVGLYYVYVANGFTTGTTILSKNLRAFGSATSNYAQAGHGAVEPASANNDRSGIAGAVFQWNVSPGGAGVRPGPFIPPDMVGGKRIIAQVDAAASVSSNWSHGIGNVIDASVDWRNRFIICYWGSSIFNSLGAASLATDPAGPGSTHFRVPVPGLGGSVQGNNTGQGVQFSNTFSTANDTMVTGNPNVVVIGGVAGANPPYADWPSGGIVGIYCDATTGALKWWANSTTTSFGQLAFWIDASAALPNN